MLQELITSKTRIQLLFMFFLNQENISYLRELAHLMNESTNSVRQELTKLEALQLLISFKLGNKKFYRANVSHAFFPDIRNMLLKEIGFDSVRTHLYQEVSGLSEIWVIGSHAKGLNSNIIDLVLVGQQLDNNKIGDTLRDVELTIRKKIRFIILQTNEFSNFLGHQKMFKI